MLVENQNLWRKRFGLWFIETKDEKEIIGLVGLYFFDEKQPQLVYALLPDQKAMLPKPKYMEYCFNEQLSFIASCDKPNLESESSRKNCNERVEEKAWMATLYYSSGLRDCG